MRVRKWSCNFHFGRHYSFKSTVNAPRCLETCRPVIVVFFTLLCLWCILTSRRRANRSTRSRSTRWFLITPISSFSASFPNSVHWSLSRSSSLDSVSLRTSLGSKVRNGLGCRCNGFVVSVLFGSIDLFMLWPGEDCFFVSKPRCRSVILNIIFFSEIKKSLLHRNGRTKYMCSDKRYSSFNKPI